MPAAPARQAPAPRAPRAGYSREIAAATSAPADRGRQGAGRDRAACTCRAPGKARKARSPNPGRGRSAPAEMAASAAPPLPPWPQPLRVRPSDMNRWMRSRTRNRARPGRNPCPAIVAPPTVRPAPAPPIRAPASRGLCPRALPEGKAMAKDVKKVVLAYSGGLDTSVILKWLQPTYQAEGVTFTGELGQGAEIEPARDKAKLLGIKPSNIFIEDVKEEFVRDYVFPMFRANALYEGQYLLGTSIARPLIAKKQIEIARKVGADAVAHGATGKGNDQVRFELAYYALEPNIK